MEVSEQKNSKIIDGTALGFSLMLLAAAVAGAFYTGTLGSLGADFIRILISPGPLITDYFGVGSMPAAFLNAGLCGLAMWAFMVLLPGFSRVNTFAGFFLVIAHAFYGLNFLNLWPCFLAPFLYIRLRRLDYNENLHICMLSTCFGPFISELLFRYAQGESWTPGTAALTGKGVILALILVLVLALVAPAILPGSKAICSTAPWGLPPPPPWPLTTRSMPASGILTGFSAASFSCCSLPPAWRRAIS